VAETQSKQDVLSFQESWLRPAGVMAIAGALLFAVSLVLQQAGVGDNDAERLQLFHDHQGQLMLAQAINSIGFLLFAPALYVLFWSARARSDRVRQAMVVFTVIGPIIFAVSNLVLAFGLKDVSKTYVDQVPAKEAQARQQAQAAQAPGAKPAGKGSKGTTSTGATSTGAITTTTAAAKSPDQAASDAKDDFANDLIDDSSTVKTGAGLRFPAILGLLIGLIYIPLWAMRTGLLTRFWATLGMALGASLILLPFGILGVVIWFAALGLMLGGWWPGPRPPAWAAGEAIPWMRPEDEFGTRGGPPGGASGGGPIEGSGREIEEPPLPEDGATESPEDSSGPGSPYGDTQGQRRKKRKRRD
jgi:hypothetical protein